MPKASLINCVFNFIYKWGETAVDLRISKLFYQCFVGLHYKFSFERDKNFILLKNSMHFKAKAWLSLLQFNGCEWISFIRKLYQTCAHSLMKNGFKFYETIFIFTRKMHKVFMWQFSWNSISTFYVSGTTFAAFHANPNFIINEI